MRDKWRAGALIGVLLALLGFAIAVQVQSRSGDDSLAGLREEDLVRILDEQNARAARLRQQISELENTLRQLQDSGNQASVAREQAQREAQALGVLLGTLPATGPGVVVRITDPTLALTAEDLLDVIQELRGAGAEAIQFGPVRVTTSTSLRDGQGGILVDGTPVAPPYVVTAIGEPKTLDTALNIPGGVAAIARSVGGDAVVEQRDKVEIRVVRTLPGPRYATPSPR